MRAIHTVVDGRPAGGSQDPLTAGDGTTPRSLEGGSTVHASSPTVVVIEGIDGAGKSSQCGRVAERLTDRGLRVVTCAPDRPLRRVYKSLIDDADGFPDARTSVLLGLADYAYATQDVPPADVVLLDRYAYSSCADALALGMRPDQVLPLLRLFDAPDLTLLVDVSPREALARKGGACSLAEAGGPEVLRGAGSLPDAFVTYQNAVRDGFLRLFASHTGRHGFHVVDGERSLDDVTDALCDVVLRACGAGLPEAVDA